MSNAVHNASALTWLQMAMWTLWSTWMEYDGRSNRGSGFLKALMYLGKIFSLIGMRGRAFSSHLQWLNQMAMNKCIGMSEVDPTTKRHQRKPCIVSLGDIRWPNEMCCHWRWWSGNIPKRMILQPIPVIYCIELDVDMMSTKNQPSCRQEGYNVVLLESATRS